MSISPKPHVRNICSNICSVLSQVLFCFLILQWRVDQNMSPRYLGCQLGVCIPTSSIVQKRNSAGYLKRHCIMGFWELAPYTQNHHTWCQLKFVDKQSFAASFCWQTGEENAAVSDWTSVPKERTQRGRALTPIKKNVRTFLTFAPGLQFYCKKRN